MMDVFTQTFGLDPDALKSFVEWTLTAVVIIFSVFVIKGSYVRWTEDEGSALEVWFDTVLSMMVVVYVGFLID